VSRTVPEMRRKVPGTWLVMKDTWSILDFLELFLESVDGAHAERRGGGRTTSKATNGPRFHHSLDRDLHALVTARD
jgi:hypothetical protein